jgi:circadian clock protein KaiC
MKSKKKSAKKLTSRKVKKVVKTASKRVLKPSEKISSGVRGLDLITKGGFRRNSTNIVMGEAGSGKTVLGVQFILEGIKKNEPGLFITFEEKRSNFYNNMKDLGWDLEALEKQGKFFFLEYSPEKVKSMLEEGGGMIESLVLRRKIKRVAIDSITSFVLLFGKDIEKREAALSLFDLLRKWDCTTIITFEGSPRKDKSSLLEFESDSIILLYFVRKRRERERFIEVLKMRGAEHSKKIYPFVIKKGGILINNRPISGILE